MPLRAVGNGWELDPRGAVAGKLVLRGREENVEHLAQTHAPVPVLPGDTEATLSQRVLIQEHIIYPLAVNWFCQGRLRCDAGKARLDGQPLDEPVQISGSSPEIPS